MSFVTQTLLTRDVSVFAYITKHQPHTFISVSLLLEGLKIVSTVLDYSRTSSVSAFGKDNACSKRKKTDLCGLREKSDYRMILAYRGKVPVTVAVLWTQKSQ